MPTYNVPSVPELMAASTSHRELAGRLGLTPTKGGKPVAGCLIEAIPDAVFPIGKTVSIVEVGAELEDGAVPDDEADKEGDVLPYGGAVRIADDRPPGRVILLTTGFRPVGIWYPDINCLVLPTILAIKDLIAKAELVVAEYPSLGPSRDAPDLTKSLRVTVGCDPEFEAYIGDQFVPGVRFCWSLTEPIGSDAAGAQVEFRPRPGTPENVVSDLRRLFKRFSTHFGLYLDGAGHRVACGGHIHLGFEFLGSWVPFQDSQIEAYVQALDAALGASVQKSGRARKDYACRRAWEQKQWGFEYRTPPAAIFGSPELALAALTIAHKVAFRLARYGSVTISDPPTVDELTAIGVPKSLAVTWHRFLESPVPDTIPMLDNWGAPVPMRITFSGSWATDVKLAMQMQLTELAATLGSAPSAVHLYGLGARRGLVATIPVRHRGDDGIEDWGILEYPPYLPIRDGAIQIGLPWAFRIGKLATAGIVQTVAEAIMEYAIRLQQAINGFSRPSPDGPGADQE